MCRSLHRGLVLAGLMIPADRGRVAAAIVRTTDQAHAVAIALNTESETIVLDLVKPFRAGRNFDPGNGDAKLKRLKHASEIGISHRFCESKRAPPPSGALAAPGARSAVRTHGGLSGGKVNLSRRLPKGEPPERMSPAVLLRGSPVARVGFRHAQHIASEAFSDVIGHIARPALRGVEGHDPQLAASPLPNLPRLRALALFGRRLAERAGCPVRTLRGISQRRATFCTTRPMMLASSLRRQVPLLRRQVPLSSASPIRHRSPRSRPRVAG